MKAIINDAYGSPDDVLRPDHVDTPTPADDQILVRVEAAGVHRGDWHATTGLPYTVRPAEFGAVRPTVAVRGTDLARRHRHHGRSRRAPLPAGRHRVRVGGAFAEHRVLVVGASGGVCTR